LIQINGTGFRQERLSLSERHCQRRQSKECTACRRGYMVVAPGTGYGAAALDDPERGLYSLFFSKVGSCDNPNFRDAGP
jgi:hypothetical protein